MEQKFYYLSIFFIQLQVDWVIKSLYHTKYTLIKLKKKHDIFIVGVTKLFI